MRDRWRVAVLDVVLPEPVRAFEDQDFLALGCTRCTWAVWFSAVGAVPAEILKTARTHVAECPAIADTLVRPVRSLTVDGHKAI